MKKLISMLLSALICVGCLAGCAGDTDSSSSSSAEKSTTTDAISTEKSDEEVYSKQVFVDNVTICLPDSAVLNENASIYSGDTIREQYDLEWGSIIVKSEPILLGGGEDIFDYYEIAGYSLDPTDYTLYRIGSNQEIRAIARVNNNGTEIEGSLEFYSENDQISIYTWSDNISDTKMDVYLGEIALNISSH
ncbi:MAG: hypothetical protein IJH80_10785 [Ruminococcus sp.]|nr:hypothetical protein [Ruminococcus sp.]